MKKQDKAIPFLKRVGKKVRRFPEWCLHYFMDEHPVWGFVGAMIMSVLFVLVMFLGVDYGKKTVNRWNGWINAHRTELVPEIQSNFDACFGSPNADRPYKFCEEPPDWYKSYWVWKNY